MSLSDVLDRVLDKGIVIDPWVRMSPVGIDVTTAGARLIITAIDIFGAHTETAGIHGTRPPASGNAVWELAGWSETSDILS